ncbi:MAG: protein translocase subunit SecD [Candidatus Pacebacteria bacterium]|nr:protein translocase subunit SecD [Candidatus Paceibacterota bacterium]
MWNIRIKAIIILLLSALIAFFVIYSEKNNLEKYAFHLGLDLSGGSSLTYQADISAITEDPASAVASLRDVIERRVNLFGVSEPNIQTEEVRIGTEGNDPEYRLIVELPGITDIDEAIAMIGQTPLLEFKTESEAGIQAMSELTVGEDGVVDMGTISVDSMYEPTDLTGRYLKRASLQFDPTTRQPSIGLLFDDEGSKLFEQLTEQSIDKTLAIYLDGALLSAPMVREKITGGEAVITGTFTPEEAKTMVGRLNSGALPVPIELVQTNIIGAGLGSGAISAGIMAGLIGLLVISLFLIIWYRLPGLIASVALIVYTLIMLALFKLIPVVLTAAGIAGFIISLGMAVDANILIFERMKEELDAGRGVFDAIKTGFDRAWLSIRDGNLSSILSALILFWFGTSLIQGFALTFGLGVLVSMISAITVSRLFLLVLAPSEGSKVSRFLFNNGFGLKKDTKHNNQ